jgi:hypothetical protein
MRRSRAVSNFYRAVRKANQLAEVTGEDTNIEVADSTYVDYFVYASIRSLEYNLRYGKHFPRRFAIESLCYLFLSKKLSDW